MNQPNFYTEFESRFGHLHHLILLSGEVCYLWTQQPRLIS